MTFRFYRFRFQFRAAGPIYFPPYKSGNMARGAFGGILRQLVCAPDCRETKVCAARANCPYARVFEPQAARGEGPSGLVDWPRPFVFRASHLDGRTIRAGEAFHFDVHLFDTRDPPVAYFFQTFLRLGMEGFGASRARADLTAVNQLDSAGVTVESISRSEPDAVRSGPRLSEGVKKSRFAGETACATTAIGVFAPVGQTNPSASPAGERFLRSFSASSASAIPYGTCERICLASPIAVDLNAPTEPIARAKVRFVTPTELKSAGHVIQRPEFGVLFGRLRDRISTLCALYGEGPLAIDFRAMGKRAARVRMTRCELRPAQADRVSSRTGQRHSIGGFVGEVEYEGELGEFMSYLRLGHWVGVGRQTVWGKGHLEVL